MSPYEYALFAAVAVTLIAAVVAVGLPRRTAAEPVPQSAPPSAIAPPPPDAWVPAGLDDTFWFHQLEVGLPIVLVTETARYTLVLKDPATNLFDVSRVRRVDDRLEKSRFEAIVHGTFLPGRGLMDRRLVVGGRLSYLRMQDELCGMITSMRIERILYSVPSRQAA